MDETALLDLLVVGAGLTGLTAALRSRREQPGLSLAVVEALPQPGGTLRTQRSNGFACELGAFGFRREEVEPVLGLLEQPPLLVEALPSGHQGWVWDGERRHLVTVDPLPWSFRSGADEVAQACRRTLGPSLRLGRAATALRNAEGTWEVDLAGEVPTTLRARSLQLCTPTAVAAHLLAPFDPALANVTDRLCSEDRAFAFFGGYQRDLPELTGYGALPADGLDSPAVEMIFCSQVFAGRSLPGQALIRIELTGPLLADDDATVLATAEQELRHWTGCRGHLGFSKLHRFSTEVANAARVEAQARLRGLAARAPGLRC